MPTFSNTGEAPVTYAPQQSCLRQHLPGYLTVAAGVILGLLVGHLAVRYDRPGWVALLCWVGLWTVIMAGDVRDMLKGERLQP